MQNNELELSVNELKFAAINDHPPPCWCNAVALAIFSVLLRQRYSKSEGIFQIR